MFVTTLAANSENVYTVYTVTKQQRNMQAQNTLYYSVNKQKNKEALFVCFAFHTVLNMRAAQSVPQRIAHYVATVQLQNYDTVAIEQQIAHIVAQQQKRDNAAQVCCV